MFHILSLTFLFCLFSVQVFPHKMPVHPTEQYIPIGLSPGLSKHWTELGCVTDTDSERKTIFFKTQRRTLKGKVLKKSFVYIDRSGDQRTNLVGKFSDLRVGNYIEVEYFDHVVPFDIRWLKVDGARESMKCL